MIVLDIHDFVDNLVEGFGFTYICVYLKETHNYHSILPGYFSNDVDKSIKLLGVVVTIFNFLVFEIIRVFVFDST